MKKINSFLFVLVVAILMIGCTDYTEDFSKIKDEEEAIIKAFGEYNSEKETGIVFINEKKDEKDRTYIYYVFKPPSLEQYKDVLRTNSSNKRKQNQMKNKIISELEKDASEEIIPKVKKLYTNAKIDKIRMEVGIVWPYGKHSYIKPGEDIIGKNILYIKTFNFTRSNYNEVLKEVTQDLKV